MAFDIVNGRIKGARYVAANSCGGKFVPKLIILHDTAGRLEKFNSVGWFASKPCKTSAHAVVERDGTITQMVPFDRKAFHAGASSWNGKQFCNSFAIGIEIVNPGIMDANGKAWFGPATDLPVTKKSTKEHGSGYWLAYTPEQIRTVKDLCRALAEEYEDVNDITTHWHVSPGRKIDTNPLFPLEDVRAYAFGHDEPEPEISPPEIAVPKPVTPKDLVKVSRKASWLSRLLKALHSIWGGLSIASVLAYFGVAKETIDSVEQVIQNNAIALMIGGAILGALALKYVLSLMVEDVNEGRAVPSGSETA